MSSTIWTRCAGDSEIEPLAGRAWRMVEAQHRVATLGLVDDLEEQELLEEMIERVKPPLPDADEFRGLHYLLATPFRYPPLQRGSRFATRAERSPWYGAERELTALAEVAYYRLLFLEGTTADLGTVGTEHSLFAVPYRTARGVDLTAPAFAPCAAEIESRTSYAATQPLGAAMRASGVEAFLWRSARDPGGGRNVGIFTPRAFAARAPRADSLQTWHCAAGRERIVFVRRDLLRERRFAFRRDDFLVDGALPAPAV